jgi:glycosyltransferase involved in cell wall biosynthesis
MTWSGTFKFRWSLYMIRHAQYLWRRTTEPLHAILRCIRSSSMDRKNTLPGLLFVSMHDPSDVRAWSGTVHNMARMLEAQGFGVEYMANLMRDRRLLMKVVARSRAYLKGGRPEPVDRRLQTSIKMAKLIEQRLEKSGVEIVFSPGSIPLARLRTPHLKVFQTDATFAGIIHQYPELADYPPEYIQEGHDLEREALENCDLAIYSSHWAANSAVNDYGAAPEKVIVVPFGSNLGVEVDREHVTRAIRQRPAQRCDLLFVGVHWERKGGQAVLDTAEALIAMGLDVRVNIIGTRPPMEELPAYVNVIPFLDKRKPAELQRLIEIVERSHFLVLPSRADCTPIVVNECNSLGVPCLTSDVGGLPEMIREGRNGHLFALDIPATAYAECIARYMNDRQAYEELALSSYREHEEWLGWKASGTRVKNAIMERMAATRGRVKAGN